MNEDRYQILELLAAGKITVDEAERLINAVETERFAPAGEYSSSFASSGGTLVKTKAKYLRVLVDADESTADTKNQTTVNVRVPLQLLRAGVRLASLIPVQAHEQLDDALNKQGVPFTLSQIKRENLEELIDHLDDLTVDVNSTEGNGTKVRVFCE